MQATSHFVTFHLFFFFSKFINLRINSNTDSNTVDQVVKLTDNFLSGVIALAQFPFSKQLSQNKEETEKVCNGK